MKETDISDATFRRDRGMLDRYWMFRAQLTAKGHHIRAEQNITSTNQKSWFKLFTTHIPLSRLGEVLGEREAKWITQAETKQRWEPYQQVQHAKLFIYFDLLQSEKRGVTFDSPGLPSTKGSAVPHHARRREGGERGISSEWQRRHRPVTPLLLWHRVASETSSAAFIPSGQWSIQPSSIVFLLPARA